MWELNNTSLNNKCLKEEIKKCPETNKNGNTPPQNLQDIAKVVLRGKFIVINTNIKKIYIYIYISQKKPSNSIPQGTRKRRTN